MNPAAIDPSLRTGQRPLDSLEDGFSPPVPDAQDSDTPEPAAPDDREPTLSTKSLF